VWIQGRDEHEGPFQVLRDPFAVRLDADGAVLAEAIASVRQQSTALQEIVDHHRPEHVQLEVAACPPDPDGDVVAQYLRAEHRERFRLRRVDLPGHDRAAGLVGGNRELAESGPRSGRQPADVVGDLHQRRGQGTQRTVCKDDRVARRQRLELVGPDSSCCKR